MVLFELCYCNKKKSIVEISVPCITDAFTQATQAKCFLRFACRVY